jgi:hypothetical protein
MVASLALTVFAQQIISTSDRLELDDVRLFSASNFDVTVKIHC